MNVCAERLDPRDVVVVHGIHVTTPVRSACFDMRYARTGEVSVRSAGRRTGSRIDPLGVLRKVEVCKGADGWSPDAKMAGKGFRLGNNAFAATDGSKRVTVKQDHEREWAGPCRPRQIGFGI